MKQTHVVFFAIGDTIDEYEKKKRRIETEIYLIRLSVQINMLP